MKFIFDLGDSWDEKPKYSNSNHGGFLEKQRNNVGIFCSARFVWTYLGW